MVEEEEKEEEKDVVVVVVEGMVVVLKALLSLWDMLYNDFSENTMMKKIGYQPTDRQIDRPTDQQTNRLTDRPTNGHIFL